MKRKAVDFNLWEEICNNKAKLFLTPKKTRTRKGRFSKTRWWRCQQRKEREKEQWRRREREMKQRELTVALCLIWAGTLLYGEMLAFWLPSLWTCSWPHLLLRPNSTVTSFVTNFILHSTAKIQLWVWLK